MSRVIVIEFVTLDGVMQDPDGNQGFEQGGWVFRFGPEAVTGDPFRLGELLDTGALLLGRRTWELFSHIWPGRDDDFSKKMNAIPKLVFSRSLDQAGAWNNSAVRRSGGGRYRPRVPGFRGDDGQAPGAGPAEDHHCPDPVPRALRRRASRAAACGTCGGAPDRHRGARPDRRRGRGPGGPGGRGGAAGPAAGRPDARRA